MQPVLLFLKVLKRDFVRTYRLFICFVFVTPAVPPRIIEKEVAADTDVYEYGKSPTLRCTARGFPIPEHIQWQWLSKEDCPEAFT